MDTNTPLPAKKKRKKAPLIRIVSMLDDALLAERSRTWHAIFLDHQVQFEVLDPNLTMTYANNWLAKIVAFEQIPHDETVEDGQMQATADVADAARALLKKVDDLEYFTERAFPDNGRMMMECGFEAVRKASQTSIPRTIVNAFTMKRVTVDYHVQLLAAGMPATLPAEVQSAIDFLMAAELKQEYEKRLRMRTTTLRINTFNELYRIHQQVRKAADVVFREQPVIAQQFG